MPEVCYIRASGLDPLFLVPLPPSPCHSLSPHLLSKYSLVVRVLYDVEQVREGG